uniref:Ubiquitin-protein ligase n=1 Tax=Solanum tuberosum TaxID=4113 RepID=M1ASP7_SOLTU
MASRSQQLPNARSSHVEKQVPAQVAEDEEEEEVEQNAKEEEVEWGYNDDSEDDNIPSRQRYDEPEVLILQNTSSQSWNTNPYQEVTDDSYHFPSPSSLQSQSSNIYSQPCSSSTGHPATVSCLSLDLLARYSC